MIQIYYKLRKNSTSIRKRVYIFAAMTSSHSKTMCSRPMVTVYSLTDSSSQPELETAHQIPLPDVFESPIRSDLVNFVHHQISKNRRQPYAVSRLAGVQCSAASWGTGRAVARIPRVRGSGTHRASQGAYGNMCRGGHMFNPTTVWRKWHRRVNRTQRRHAIVSGLSASALPALVYARGHRISQVPELPLVIQKFSVTKTKNALQLLKAVGVYEDVERCKESRKIRVGKGKMRNRRYVTRRGPLLVHTESGDSDLVHSFRNIPGIDLVHVERLNLLKLCPGGHLGRLIIWTEEAFIRLGEIYPNQHGISDAKKGYSLPHPLLSMPDISRIINSDEVQKVLRAKKPKLSSIPKKRNPLKHKDVMASLNPLAGILRKSQLHATQKLVQA
ncbi:hypothetical protein MXB_37 [Myxobolus squamalis]|nr:hypothetical protein MXB_37 [Myxobolus squamalis]